MLACFCTTPVFASAGTGRTEVVMLYREDLVKVRDMDFGISIPVGGGTIQINAQKEARIDIAWSAVLAGGTVSAGRFDAIGLPNRIVTFTINPNNNVTLTRVCGTETMTLQRFRLSLNGGAEQPVGPNYSLGPSGIVVIRIGGRLVVGASQREGQYAGTFTAATNYQ